MPKAYVHKAITLDPLDDKDLIDWFEENKGVASRTLRQLLRWHISRQREVKR